MHLPPHRITATNKMLAAAIALATCICAAPVLGQSGSFAAPGRVEGAGPVMPIGVATGGIVGAVLVHGGDRVRAGQLLLKLDCQPLEDDVHTRETHLRASQAVFDRVRNGPRPDEIAVGEAVVGYSQARADEAQKTLERTEALQEGITVTAARVLEVKRDARIAAAQLEEAKARLSLLRAGSREEDIRQSEALRDAAASELEAARARLEQCSVHAPMDGTVLDVLASPGQYLSMAVPQPLLHIVADGQLRVRAEVDVHEVRRVCAQQHATIAADAFPNTTIQAQVASISPEISARSIGAGAAGTTAADTGPKDVVVVVLNVDRGAPALPIGLPVTVHFDTCPSKT